MIVVALFAYVFYGAVCFFIAGAGYYAYQINRIVGSFRAWTFLIIALFLFAIEEFLTLGAVVLFSPAKLASAVNSASAGGLIFEILITLSISLLFFMAMRELHGLFGKQIKKDSKTGEQSVPHITN